MRLRENVVQKYAIRESTNSVFMCCRCLRIWSGQDDLTAHQIHSPYWESPEAASPTTQLPNRWPLSSSHTLPSLLKTARTGCAPSSDPLLICALDPTCSHLLKSRAPISVPSLPWNMLSFWFSTVMSFFKHKCTIFLKQKTFFDPQPPSASVPVTYSSFQQGFFCCCWGVV